MYEREYTCTRKLTTVTTASITAASGSTWMPSVRKDSVVGVAPVDGQRRIQSKLKVAVWPAMTAGRMTNNDSSIDPAMARMPTAADNGWFLRVTKTIRTNASSGKRRMVKAVAMR